jgi:hypothetical protein
VFLTFGFYPRALVLVFEQLVAAECPAPAGYQSGGESKFRSIAYVFGIRALVAIVALVARRREELELDVVRVTEDKH